MKYFTKEWYLKMQKCDYDSDLEYDPQAEIYSDEFFNKLYADKRKEIVFDDHYATETLKDYDEYLKMYIQELENELPEYITSLIADIRILALGKASQLVINMVKEYCNKNSREVKRVVDAYDQYYQIVKGDSRFFFIEDMYFHDCSIIETQVSNSNLIIKIENYIDESEYSIIEFKNFEILNQDRDITKLWWIYHEIYYSEGKYELHLLLIDVSERNWNLTEFTVQFDEIVIDHK